MFVLDTNDLSVQYRLYTELADLKAEHEYYRHKLKELKQERAAVMGNPALLEKYAREKLKKKSCDLIVANDIESGKIFGSEETKAFFISAKKSQALGKISKVELAKLLSEKIVKWQVLNILLAFSSFL